MFCPAARRTRSRWAPIFMLVGNQTGRRSGKPVGYPHVLDTFTERRLEALQQLFVIFITSRGGIFFLFALQRVYIEFALSHRAKVLALVFLQVVRHPFVDLIRQQKNFYFVFFVVA